MADKRSEVKARFIAEGVSIADWARNNSFNVVMVYRVLAGTVKGQRGEAHRIALALGLKTAVKAARFSSEHRRRSLSLSAA